MCAVVEGVGRGGHTILAWTVREFMPIDALMQQQLPGMARQVPWLKVSKELHMLSHVCVCVMCVASFPFSPHTGRQQQPHCMHCAYMACMCAFLHAVVFALLLWIYGSPCVVLALTHTLTPHAVHKPLCEWVSEWCVCIALNSLLLLQ